MNNNIIAQLISHVTSPRSPLSQTLAAIILIWLFHAFIAWGKGMDGNCSVSNFKWDVTSHIGCSTGRFLRGMFEAMPNPPSLQQNSPNPGN